jgi:hypothetical protein
VEELARVALMRLHDLLGEQPQIAKVVLDLLDNLRRIW